MAQVYARMRASCALQEYFFLKMGNQHTPVFIASSGTVKYMPAGGPLHMHLNSNMCEIEAEQQTTVENTNWFDTKGMPTGRGLRRLMNQCSHPLPDRGFGPRLTVPLTKEQVVKAKKEGRFVRASKCVQQIIVTNPINPRSPCLLPCCNKYTKGVRRKYVNITDSELCQPVIQPHSKTLATLDARIATQKAFKKESQRQPDVPVTDEAPCMHSLEVLLKFSSMLIVYHPLILLLNTTTQNTHCVR
jgi:hypothetical protein